MWCIRAFSRVLSAGAVHTGGCCCTVRTRCGTVLMFLEILLSKETHRKPLWRVSPDACGWSPEAIG